MLLEGGMMYGPDVLEPLNQVLLAELDTMLTHHPRLPVLLQNSKWESARYLHTLMSKHKNLHLEFSNHQGNHALEVYGGWFGFDRILFGSGALDKSPGAAKAFVDYSTITPEQKAMVAGGNLARLLRLNAMPPEYSGKIPDDPILRAARAGKPLKNLTVIDAHAHINEDGAVGRRLHASAVLRCAFHVRACKADGNR